MRYAVNIYDWNELIDPDPSASVLLSPESILLRPLLLPEVVRCNPKYPDEDAFLVKDDVTPERWSAIVKLLREKFKHHRNKRRLYESKTGKGGWKRV